MSQAVRRPDIEIAREKNPAAEIRQSSFPFALPEVSPRMRGFFFLFLMWIVLKNTWLCEDAFITYRVVDNFVHGLGLRWNPLERVQTFTHPLWTLLVSAVYFVARDVYFAPVIVSLGCTAAALWLLLYRSMKSLPQCLLATVILGSSKAFMDFSTSGLENPLSHLLLALFAIEHLKSYDERRFDRMVWYAGLAITNRMDLVWLFLPALAYQVWKGGEARKPRAWIGLSPFIAWELFSLLYYGFLFPNTAYAKLGSGVHLKSMLMQGECYLLNSLSWDPITLFTIVGLVGIVFFTLREDRPATLVAIGVVLSVA